MEKYKKVLLIVAHQDDEVMCGGTIARLVSDGSEVTELVLTNGVEGGESKDLIKVRNRELEKSARILGIKKILSFSEDDLGLIYSKDLMIRVMVEIRKIKPDLVILMHRADYHPDHREAYKIGVEAVKWTGSGIKKELGKPHTVGEIWMMSGMAPIRPTIMVDVTDFVKIKIEALKAHKSQVNQRLIDHQMGLMQVYGYQLQNGGNLAEGFEVERLTI